jgi:predicted dehydrogenase
VESSSTVPRVIITGVRGFGAHHLENARRLQADGRLRVVALADPAVQEPALDGIPVFADLDPALHEHPADVVIVATPIDTHEALCASAMRAGADVLLEKPPVATMADFDTLLALQQETGRAIQVGFQSLGSHAIDAFAKDAFGLGELVAVSAKGLWTRPRRYWSRARWAGRRTLDGHPVVDGVTTNPLAHAVATALRIAGYRDAASVADVETDLYRVNAIESDDTSVVRITGDGRVPVTCALTLCAAPRQTEDRGATVIVTGTRGTAELSYTTDVVTSGGERTTLGRDDLLTNLLEHRESGRPLITPLRDVGAFMRVVEAVRLAPEPTTIDPAFVEWRSPDGDLEGTDAYPVLEGIDEWVDRAAAEGRTFTALGTPWSHAERDRVLATASVDGGFVADLLDGAGTIPFSSPHPYLHPVRTPSGVTLTARHPADHDWHVGLSFTVQDADGVNFWGGRTYVAGQGYQRLDDHGVIRTDSVEHDGDRIVQHLSWIGPDGDTVLTERRGLRASALSAAGPGASAQRAAAPRDATRLLELDTRLTPAHGEVVLGSPGSKGRVDAGYGGLFWRLPACRDVDVYTADAEGEQAVNGSVSGWLAFSARFLAGPGENGEATIVLLPGDEETAGDPWFVRVEGYPGLGSAVAWDATTTVPETGLVRRYLAVVADGRQTRERTVELAAQAAERAEMRS